MCPNNFHLFSKIVKDSISSLLFWYTILFLIVIGYFTFITFLSCFPWNASNCSSSFFVGLHVPELYSNIGLMIDLYNFNHKLCLILSFLNHILFILFSAAVASCFLRLISSVTHSRDPSFFVVIQFSVSSFFIIILKSFLQFTTITLDLSLSLYYGFFCFNLIHFEVFPFCSVF